MTASVVDDEWLSAPPKRSRLRVALLGLLALGLVFLAGVEVQKRYGAPAAATSAAAPRFIGGGGFTPPTGAGSATGGVTTGGATGGTTGGTTTPTAAVIGTVVSVKGDVWTIKDLGGTVHTVTVSNSVRIVKEKQLAASAVPAGATVDVAGSTDQQGRVTATTITVR